MHLSNLIYMLHQMRDVMVSIWAWSPPVVSIVALALVAVAFFVFRR